MTNEEEEPHAKTQRTLSQKFYRIFFARFASLREIFFFAPLREPRF
jgi:hypothetical protein